MLATTVSQAPLVLPCATSAEPPYRPAATTPPPPPCPRTGNVFTGRPTAGGWTVFSSQRALCDKGLGVGPDHQQHHSMDKNSPCCATRWGQKFTALCHRMGARRAGGPACVTRAGGALGGPGARRTGWAGRVRVGRAGRAGHVSDGLGGPGARQMGRARIGRARPPRPARPTRAQPAPRGPGPSDV